MQLPFQKRTGPLFDTKQYRDTKDPCPVFDGTQWHIFGSGGSSTVETWHILHATGPSVDGPWTEQDSVTLEGVQGTHVAAPGVVFDEEEGIFHMFVQTDFLALGGTVEHLVSEDGNTFHSVDVALHSLAEGTDEACIYDPHPTVIKGEKYLTYSGAPAVGQPDLYIAKSETNSWNGPWHREGKILAHEDVPHHNQRDHHDYEWGLEGSQLLELPSGLILMNAVCFLPENTRGTRQRIFFAASKNVMGPYRTMGPVLETLPSPSDNWQSGENGHAAGVIHDKDLYLFFQSRNAKEGDAVWKYGSIRYNLHALDVFAEKIVHDAVSIRI